MIKDEQEIIKEAEITNNCPECFNQSMKITFSQRHKHGMFTHSLSKEINHKITCNTCNSIIHPVSWTTDIERIFEYHQKMVTPIKMKAHFTNLFYVTLIFIIGIICAGIYLLTLNNVL